MYVYAIGHQKDIFGPHSTVNTIRLKWMCCKLFINNGGISILTLTS